MSYLVLARKYRPDGFEEFVGQDVIAETLRNAITLDRVAHAYLFCGPRGVGKTSMARVFAKALNCEKGPTVKPCNKCDRCKAVSSGQDVDVIEIDGASNRGIDEVRDIRQNARYAAQRSRFKIYYIDEVHMLTEPAFNALLKTLEEPPAHVKFIFATTAPAKLPETILSRIQRFDFRRISNTDIIRQLKTICKAEKIKAPDDALLLVARRARGSMRDALSLFDQALSFCGENLEAEAVAAVLGALGDDELARVMTSIRDGDADALIRAADELIARGVDVGEILDQLIAYLRDLMVARVCGADPDLLDRPKESAEAVVAIAKPLETDHLLYMGQVLNQTRRRIREGQEGRIVLETALVRLAQSKGMAPMGEVIEKLLALEEALGEGALPPASAEGPAPYTRSAPSARPAAPSGGGSGWDKFLSVLQSRSSFLAMTLRGARFKGVENGAATVFFPGERRSVHDELDSAENRAIIEAALAEAFGSRLRLHVANGGAAPAPAPRSPRPVRPVRDPVVREAMDAFGGQVVQTDYDDERENG